MRKSIFFLTAAFALIINICYSKAPIDSIGNPSANQQPPPNPNGRSPITNLTGSDQALYKILYVKAEGDTSGVGKDTLLLRTAFNKRIVLYVSGPRDLFAKQEADVIYINNLKTPYPVSYNCPCKNPSDTTKDLFTLTFTLIKHDSAFWNRLYGFNDNTHKVKVDIGTSEKQYSCSNNNLTVIMYNQANLNFAWFVVIAFIILSIFLAFGKSDLIRDHTTLVTKKPYSLSRFQLLWWSVIIISCYILLYAIRDDFSLLSKTTLILLGISVAGTSFASLIDYNNSDNLRHQNQEGKFFFYDVLSDNDGISVHRYQNLVFTFIFGIIFFYKVLVTANMPDFGDLELSLMGLSTAAYVGLKAGENKTLANTPQQQTAAQSSPQTNVTGQQAPQTNPTTPLAQGNNELPANPRQQQNFQ